MGGLFGAFEKGIRFLQSRLWRGIDGLPYVWKHPFFFERCIVGIRFCFGGARPYVPSTLDPKPRNSNLPDNNCTTWENKFVYIEQDNNSARAQTLSQRDLAPLYSP